MENPPEICTLSHPVFTRFGLPVFQRAETDGEAVMTVPLGEKNVSLPLRSLRREFSIAPNTPDGRVLDLIVEALDFVTQIRIGDPFPAEVLTGEASWEPAAVHFQIALARLRLALVSWLTRGAETTKTVDPAALLAMVEDPSFRPRIQEAFERAAAELDLAGADAVVEAIEALAQELAYVEALRARLLARSHDVLRKISEIQSRWRGDTSHGETISQVQRLILRAVRQFTSRFEELDAQTGEVIAALRNDENQRSFIRANRDWLYRCLRGWEPILDAWTDTDEITDRDQWGLIERTYRFLAPRYMTVKEWTSESQASSRKKARAQMVW